MQEVAASRERRTLVRLLDAGIVMLLLILAVVYLFRRADFQLPPAEDAAMLMRYALHLAEGHGIVWNIGEKPVDGATDFLFMVMVAGLIRAGLSPEQATRMLILTAHLLTVVLIYLTGVGLFRVTRWIAALGSLYLATSAAALYVSTCFGAPVFALWASLTWLCALYLMLYGADWRWSAGFGVFSLLTGLTRPEGVLLSLLMLLGIVIARGWRQSVQPALAWLIFVVGLGGVYFLWRWDYFGHPLPNPYYKKGGGMIYLSGLRSSIMNFVWFCLPLLSIWFVALLVGSQRRLLISMMLPIIGFVGLFILLSDEMNIYGRFQYVTLPLSLMVTFPAYRVLRQRVRVDLVSNSLRDRAILRGVAFMLSILWIYIYALLTLFQDLPQWDGRYEVARVLAPYANRGYYMAVTEAGLLPFYSRWKAIDTWGLNDLWIAHHGMVSEEYLDRYKPALIMFHARYTPLISPRRNGRWDEMIDILRRYAETRGYIVAAVYTDIPYSDSAHYYYVRSGLPESQALVQRIRWVNYTYWRSGVRAIDLHPFYRPLYSGGAQFPIKRNHLAPTTGRE